MLVKCQLCGNKINRESAYKINNGKINKYYCSAEEYDTWQTEKEREKADKERVTELINRIFGYPVSNTVLFAEWKIWLTLQPNKVIGNFIEEKEGYLTQAIARLNGTEFAKIKYFSAVLKNGLKDYKPKIVKKAEIESVVADENFILHTNTKKKNNRRRGFSEEDDI